MKEELIKEIKDYPHWRRDLTYWAIVIAVVALLAVGFIWVMSIKSEAEQEFRKMEDKHYDCVNGKSDEFKMNNKDDCDRAAMYAHSVLFMKYVRYLKWSFDDWSGDYMIFNPRTWIYGGTFFLSTMLLRMFNFGISTLLLRGLYKLIGWG